VVEREQQLDQSRNLEEEKFSFPENIDVIVVHGSGLHLSKSGRQGWWPENPEARLPKSSWDQRMRLIAAGELWQRYKEQGREVPIIVSGGNVFPTLAPSIAEVMKEFLIRAFGIPEEKIVVADKGGDTVSDMEQVEKIMKERDFHKAINVSSEFHKVAEALAKKKGMKFIPAERLLKERNLRYSQIVNDLYGCSSIKKLIKNQKRMALFIKIHFGEKLYRWQAQRTLPQRAEATSFDPHALQKMTGRFGKITS
jgi:uncharacterized SAM-binding protein YcdF (DUF218 family)